ncbi:TraB/GumN family protein [Rhodospirillaceae bacterium SYSU D60014]|uniref:TraB/GumN family protein n=1 Tax=Virgifigura deserti TaxID=2268457 RepID=UPI000E670A73
MRFWRRVLIGLPFLLLVLPTDSRGEALRHGQGLLWRIEAAGVADSYLFGTFHATDRDIVTLPTPVAEAFARCDDLAFESVLDTAAKRQMTEAMLLDGGQSLDRILGPDRFGAFAAAARDHGLDPEHLKGVAPWAVMWMLSLPPEELARQVNGAKVLDERLQAEGAARGKEIHGLETVPEFLAVFDGIPLAEQGRLLDATVALHPKVREIFARMKRAYLARDVASILALTFEVQGGADPQAAQSFMDRVITQRNHRMAERLVPLLGDGNLCTAIGAGHLPGDEGVLHLLEAQGFRVERIY